MADKRFFQFENVNYLGDGPKSYHCEIGEGRFWVPFSVIVEKDFDRGHLVTYRTWAERYGAKEAYEEHLEYLKWQAEREREAKEEAARQREQAEAERVWRERAEAERERAQAAPVIDLTKPEAVFRKLALKWHPDVNSDGGEVMKDLNEYHQAVLAALKKYRG